jgi:hypothetical protein
MYKGESLDGETRNEAARTIYRSTFVGHLRLDFGPNIQSPAGFDVEALFFGALHVRPKRIFGISAVIRSTAPPRNGRAWRPRNSVAEPLPLEAVYSSHHKLAGHGRFPSSNVDLIYPGRSS